MLPPRGAGGRLATPLPSGAGTSRRSDGAAIAFSTDSMDSSAGSLLYAVNADDSGLSGVPGIPRVFDQAWRPE